MTGIELLQQENQALKIENINLSSSLENLIKQNEQYRESHERMRHQLFELMRNRFGKKSEKSNENPNQAQFDFLVNEAEVAAANEAKLNEVKIEVPAHIRKKKATKDLSHVPRTIEIIPVPDADKNCACGCQKEIIRYETKELYHYKPEEFYILEQRREVVACKKGCSNSMLTALSPLQILPKIKATPELLSNIVVKKVHDRQPLYHLEKYMGQVGVSRETMARWLIDLKTPLQPILNLMKDEVIAYDVASIDATPLQVLKEPNRKAETKSLVYCLRGGPPERSVILYGYNHSDHKQFVDEWLEGFEGTIHMDADKLFDLAISDPNVKESNCNAHARRKFESIAKQATKRGLSHIVLQFYSKLYKIERRAKDEKMTAEERYQLRQKESKPIMDEFKAWLDLNVPTVLPKSYLGNAFNYALNHWSGLCEFLNDGRLEIDNNHTEREIKPFVIARKNFLFAQSMDGAHALCLHFSLIRTALLHGLNPYDYYVMLLKRVPYCETVEDYEKLLPWNIQVTAN